MRIKTKEVDRHFLTKHYLANLPTLPEPLPQYPDSETNKLVILYPIFRGVPSEPTDSELLFRIPAAIWSKRSFLLHSDVMDYGIPIKFYIEQMIWDNPQVKEYMYAEGVTDDDVLTFDGSQMEVELPEGSADLYMGKQLCPWLDGQLDRWRLRLILDMDVFLCRTHHATVEKYNLVERILKSPWKFPDSMIGSAFMMRDFPEPNVLPENWIRASGYDPELWLDNARGATGVAIDIKAIRPVSGCASLYPRRYNELNPYFKKYLDRVSAMFQSDEPVLAVWNYLHGNREIYPLFEKLELEVAVNALHVHQFHDNPNRSFYISHIMSMWEQRWRQHIGDV